MRRLALAFLLLFAAAFTWAARPDPASFGTDQIIVRLKSDSPFRARGRGAQLAQELRAFAGENVIYRRTMAEGHKVMRLEGRRPMAAVQALANAIARHPEVLDAFPDRVVFPSATPNDEQLANQWSLTSSDGINALAAWDITTGLPQQIVAVIDTGILTHADIDAARVLGGYDFVSDTDKPRANDSDGRDPDPADPGDWVTSGESAGSEANGLLVGCPVADSTWHGTAVAGIIAANTNNTAGMAGVNWGTRILPVRALGKCGGYVSDVADAILWSVGIPVPNVPDNTQPADVINLSFESGVAGACDAALASAISFAVGQNVPVVAAAGNQSGSAASYSPANCTGVIAVGAVKRDGSKPAYANTGSPIAISAPGGDAGDNTVAIVTTSDGGTTSPLNDGAYRVYYGTSIAAAHVTGVVSLMQAVNPTLAPADIKEIIRNTSRAFPAVANACTTLLCGDGIVDAQAAVHAAASFGTATPRIAAAALYSQGLRSDGTMWSWGLNDAGQFGNGSMSSTPATNPVKATTLSGITLNTAGLGHALGLRADAVALSWGDDTWGQLGTGRSSDPLTPGVISGLTSLTRVFAGKFHTLGQKSDGTVWAWGHNNLGQLGRGSTSSFPIEDPQQVLNVSGAIQIVAGQNHSVALKSDGTVLAWGDNSLRQLGNGTSGGSSSTPAPVSGITNAVAIATGPNSDHSLALLADGSVVAWGNNTSGQLGNGCTIGSSCNTGVTSPVTVTGLTGVVALATGEKHSLALKSDGTLVAWGLNSSGQLGGCTPASNQCGTNAGNTACPAHTSATAVSGVSQVVGIAAGQLHSVALKDDGTLLAWGANASGQLGRGATTPVCTGTAAAVLASGGGSFSLDLNALEFLPQAGAPIGGLRESNTIVVQANAGGAISVGGQGSPQYRIGNGAYTSAPGNVNAGDHVTVQMTAADACNTAWTSALTIASAIHNFSVTTVAGDSTPEAFVFDTQASVGTSSLRTSNAITVAGINMAVGISVSAGGAYSIGCNGSFTSTDGTVTNGQTVCVQQTSSASNDTANTITLTIGGVSSAFSVMTVADENFAGTQMVRAGTSFSVGLRSDGTVFTWGRNASGQLGNASTANSLLPVQAAVSGVTRVGAGSGHVVALRSDGTVWSWGLNGFGQLGNGTTMTRTTPVQVPGLAGISRVAAGFIHSVALRQSDGTVWTWGYNGKGQLGNGTTTDSLAPVQVSGLTGVTKIVGGDDHTIALKSDGTVWAWGDNTYGQLGDGTTTQRLAPVQVGVGISGFSNIADIAPGSHGNHALALKQNGTMFAWGRNNFGQVGDGTTTDRSSPVQVLTSVAQIAVGELHSLALMSDATVKAWGYNGNGRLGDGTTTNRLTPVQVQGLPFAAMLAAGGSHSLAARPDGTVVAWGFNFYGQLGDGTTTSRLTPVTVQGGGLNLDSNAAFFLAQTSVALGEQRTSNTIRITGIVDGSTISVSGAGAEYKIDSGEFTSTPGTINDRQQVTLRQFASATCNTTTTVNVIIAGAPRGGGFSVTTVACDSAPDAFTFDSQSNVLLGVTATSNTVSIGGINTSADVTISNGEYSIGCNGTFTAAAGSITNGQTVCVRHTTASTVTTSTTTTLTIGGVPGTFTSTTAPQQTLSVSLSGDGTGSVLSTSPNNAISCPSTCAADYNPGANVTLAAVLAAGSMFTGWSGACSGAGGCVVNMGSSAQFVTASFALAPVLQSVKSRKTHAAAGGFDLAVDFTAPIGAGVTVESRAAASNTHKIVFAFDLTITDAGTATCVDAGSNVVGSASALAVGSTIEVTLTGVPDGKRVTISLSGVNGGGSYSASMGFLAGDVDGTRSVTASDILRAKGRLGQVTDGTNFLHDIDLGGTVDAADVSAAQANSGIEI